MAMLMKIVSEMSLTIVRYKGELIGALNFGSDKYLMDIDVLRALHGHISWTISKFDDIASGKMGTEGIGELKGPEDSGGNGKD